MSEEIKEILEQLQNAISNSRCIDGEKARRYYDAITSLQKENEKLKEENKCIFSKVNDDELLIANAMNYAELQDYKSRNEKAISFLKQIKYSFDENDEMYGLLNESIDILKG